MNPKLLTRFRILAIGLIPFLLLVFWIIFEIDESYYMWLTEEDNPVEWLTVVFLFVAAVISLAVFVKHRGSSDSRKWFFLGFFAACILFALEEISWGQRVIGVESTEFFQQHSDQQEINIHNVLQKRFYFKTKHMAARVLFYYGTVLPILALDERIKRLIDRIRLVIPPVSLSLGFFIAALMMWDRPTGREEEIGEMFFSLCFVLFMVWCWMTHREDQHW